MLTLNASAGEDTVLDAPVRPDGSLYRFEMLYAGDSRRAYADDPADLLAVLVEGYAEQDEDAQWQSRLALAARAQVLAQAEWNTSDSFHRCTPLQRDVLNGPRHEPPVVPSWDCPVPLVLIASYYAPAGGCPRPQATDGMPANVIWIDPSDDAALLTSLDEVGVITLHEAVPSA